MYLVSHHPPVTASYAEHSNTRVTYTSLIHTKEQYYKLVWKHSASYGVINIKVDQLNSEFKTKLRTFPNQNLSQIGWGVMVGYSNRDYLLPYRYLTFKFSFSVLIILNLKPYIVIFLNFLKFSFSFLIILNLKPYI